MEIEKGIPRNDIETITDIRNGYLLAFLESPPNSIQAFQYGTVVTALNYLLGWHGHNTRVIRTCLDWTRECKLSDPTFDERMEKWAVEYQKISEPPV